MTTPTRLPARLALAALIALASAFTALALSGGHDAAAHGERAQHAMHGAAPATISAKELALREDMRRLWQEHVVWTRLAIVSLATNAPDTQATVARLLRNQTDIGNAVKPFYGDAAGNRLTSLLRQHILIAADLIGAAKKGDQNGVAVQQARWARNADEIAGFLSRANPRSWKLGEMKAMMREHLGLTTNEVLARLNGSWAADVRAYDLIERQILRMADMLSDGLARQFPGRF